MSARYLFGPVTSAFAQDNLGGLRRRGTCPAFDAGGTSDLAMKPANLICRPPVQGREDPKGDDQS